MTKGTTKRSVLGQTGQFDAMPVHSDASNPSAERSSGQRSGDSPRALSEERLSFLKKLDEIVDPDAIIEAGRRLGVIERKRKVDLPTLVKATVATLLPVPGAETTVFVNYLALGGETVVASSFYDRFTDEFAELMKELALRSIEAVRQVAPSDERTNEWGVLLERFKDIRIADSTCHIVKRLARGWAPSTSKKRPAGIKLHVVMSLADSLPISGEVTAQRVHDNRAFPEHTMEPGTLSLFDLGYIDVERFVDAIERGADFLSRLKDNHDPVIKRVHVGVGSRRAAKGMRINEALREGVLDSKKGVIDLDVQLESKGRRAQARAVSVQDEQGIRHWYLTTVGRDVLTPQEVADTYRLRWEVELFFKRMKSGAGLSAILAWRPSAILAMLYAKVVAMSLAKLLELVLEQRHGPRATKQLALMLTLTRATPLLLSYFMFQQGTTLQQLEERLVNIAWVIARSRNQRRERAKRKREQAIGQANG